MQNKKGSILPFLLLSIATLIGLICSLYLTKHFYEIRSGTEGFKSACNINSVLNCDVVASSKYSEIFSGLPVSSFSAGWYIAFFIIGLLSQIKETSREAKRIIFVMAGIGVFSSVYFLWLMAGVLHTYCLFCLVIDCSNIIILISALIMRPVGVSKTKPPINWGQLRNISCIALTGFIISVFLIMESVETKSVVISDEKVHSILESPPMAVETTQSPSIGNSLAPITIVEFSDFQCPFCKTVALNLHSLMDRYPGKIRIVFKNFPLNSECNYTITQTVHSFACEAARVGFCVQNQGKFKEIYEALFENQQKLAAGVSIDFAKQIGSDIPLLLECMVSAKASLKIEQDVSEGLQLGVEATPTLFFNGHKVKGAIPLSLWEKMVDVTLSQQSLVKNK